MLLWSYSFFVITKSEGNKSFHWKRFVLSLVPRLLIGKEMERELQEINKTLKSTSSNEDMLVFKAGKEAAVVEIRANVSPEDVRVIEVEDQEPTPEGSQKLVRKCVDVKVNVQSSRVSFKDVVFSVSAPLPLTVHPANFTVPELSPSSQSSSFSVAVVCTPSLLPTTTSLRISATYRAPDKTQHATEEEIELPLTLFCQPTYPEKNATFKITIDTEPCEATLSRLFPPQLILDHAPPHAVGLSYLSGQTVTVVASKATRRYRLQSDDLPALAVVLKWLLASLQGYFRTRNEAFTAKFVPPLPLNEYFEIVDRHFKLRKNLFQCWEWVGRHAHQFRAIQKRLLTRFKDKTPVGLAHLDTLLDGTYMQLMALCEKSEMLELELQDCSNQLSCATILMLTLLKLSANLNDEDLAILSAALSPTVSAEGEQGWEEMVDAAITHLLRTSLAKSKDPQQSLVPSKLEFLPDCQKLKKHIALLCDRINKGFLPSGGKSEVTRSLSPDASEEKVAVGGYRKQNLSQQTKQPSMPVLPENSSEVEVYPSHI